MKEKQNLVALIKSRISSWPKAILNIVLIAYAFILLEWSFYVTQASISFMYPLSFGVKVIIFLVSALMAALMAVGVSLVFCLIDLAVAAIFPKFKTYLLVFPESLLISIFGLTALDNFSYTVFHFGLSTENRWEEIPYLVAFLAANFFLVKSLAKSSGKSMRWVTTGKLALVAALTVVSLAAGSYQYFTGTSQAAQTAQTATASSTDKLMPNIIIFGTDGLSADSMSLYGASRDTTPNLDKLASTFLVSENNFTNAGHSMGSDVSMLTSKSPLETRVLYPPDILQGSDVDESLPSLLKSLGYTTAQLAIPHYADANVANIEGAFDAVNCSENSQFLYQTNRLFLFRLNDEFYMLDSIFDSAEGRLKGVFLIEKMDNPIADILNLKAYSPSDKERMDCLFNYLDEAKSSNTPLFAHIHMLTTHGSLFYPVNQKYSVGMVQTANWMDEFYADSIIDYDQYIQELVDHLKATGEYDNTILVIYTDHGEQWTTFKRIPLLFHFPNDDDAGKITANTQNMDIAPTILDYLNIDQPSWMTGSSLLEPLPTNRLIISTYTKEIEGDDSGLWGINSGFIHPPFYQFSIIQAVECQRMVIFDMEESTKTMTQVANYVAPCDLSTLDSADEIQQKVGQLLTQYGFTLPDKW